MHVLFVSECSKKAVKKTRAVLDRVATRVGRRTWATPVTEEGLSEIHSSMKAVATRQTSVACYRNDGLRKMTILWIVGNKKLFNKSGAVMCGATRGHRADVAIEPWVAIGALVSKASGCGHDIGKTEKGFVDNISGAVCENKYKASSIRHEWISMRIARLLRDRDFDLDAAWKGIKTERGLKEFPIEGGLKDLLDVLDFVLVSHHRLPGGDCGGIPECSSYFAGGHPPGGAIPGGILSPDVVSLYRKTVERIKKYEDIKTSGDFLRAISIFVRAALIFADHQVSKIEYKPPIVASQNLLYANTKRMAGRIGFNQPLQWHLEQTSFVAAASFSEMSRLTLRGLCDDDVARITFPSSAGRFEWQNKAAATLRKARNETNGPILVLNIAETGAGKTMMNAKSVCILAPQGRVRFATVLNQRSLTLQTGDALRNQLGLTKRDLAVVIGDRITRKLHDASERIEPDAETVASDSDENNIDFICDVDIDLSFDDFDELPRFLRGRGDKDRRFKRIVATPVLVSTIDYLICAGDLTRQHHHVDALLRIIDSDIIIDEIDSYDPKAIVAILRMVQVVGLCGRNLVCSSATIAPFLAEAVYRAFYSGIKMRSHLLKRNLRAKVAVIDNLVDPLVFDCSEGEEFAEKYRHHLSNISEKIGTGGMGLRIPFLQKVPCQSEGAWMEAVGNAVNTLHNENRWEFGNTGKTVSFGFVRVANIKTAIDVATYLTRTIPNAYVACYHSQDFIIQRYLKEKTLDRLLTRKPDKNGKNANAAILNDVDIKNIVKGQGFDSIQFIVVATPVEEFGRDHDFDWSVLEPSSAHSLIQASGRVNRHRRFALAEGFRNVAIMQYNFRWARGGDPPYYCMPGMETKSLPYEPAGMDGLLNWERLANGLDSRLCFTKDHKIAGFDERNAKAIMDDQVDALCNMSSKRWMTANFYKSFPLRSGGAKQSWRCVDDGHGHDVFERLRIFSGEWGPRYVVADELVQEIGHIDNRWLCWDTVDLREKCKQLGIPPEEGMCFEIAHNSNGKKIGFHRSFGFRVI